MKSEDITGGLDLLGDWLDAKGYTEEAGLCTRAMDEINRLREARDECERQYQEQVNKVGDVLEERNILRAENALLQERLADEEYVSKDLEEMFQNMRTETEALRAENARLQQLLEEESKDYVRVLELTEENKRLRAENAKLRRIRSAMNNLLYAIDCFPNDLGNQLTDAVSAARAEMGESDD